jgi:hypothetical protein
MTHIFAICKPSFVYSVTLHKYGYTGSSAASYSSRKKSVPLGHCSAVAVYGMQYCTSTKPRRPKLWTSLRSRLPASARHDRPYSSVTPGPWRVVMGVSLTGVTQRADGSGIDSAPAVLGPSVSRPVSRRAGRRAGHGTGGLLAARRAGVPPPPCCPRSWDNCKLGPPSYGLAPPAGAGRHLLPARARCVAR